MWSGPCISTASRNVHFEPSNGCESEAFIDSDSLEGAFEVDGHTAGLGTSQNRLGQQRAGSLSLVVRANTDRREAYGWLL
ncbi:hypothetical protein PspLS_00598 [Pyricularia sp. CBS 133598]|nr:hypothetical protein PspLS_00598 [Pyricularia sp. CBS 133598]